jgi:hypothetical protein
MPPFTSEKAHDDRRGKDLNSSRHTDSNPGVTATKKEWVRPVIWRFIRFSKGDLFSN